MIKGKCIDIIMDMITGIGRILSFTSTFYTAVQFGKFLSVFPPLSTNLPVTLIKSPDGSYNRETILDALIDFGLVLLFTSQHSILKEKYLTKLFGQRFSFIFNTYRIIYVITTNAVILLLTNQWRLLNPFPIWNLKDFIDMKYFDYVNYGAMSLHIFAWYIIYASSLIMDLADLTGLSGNERKKRQSQSLQRFYGHIRHGSFLGFTVIFFARPMMTLDRLLLGLLMTTYMYLKWRPDSEDLDYQESMWAYKQRKLKNL